MSYDASAQTLRCPFCGSEKLSKQADTKSIAPKRIIRFAVDHEQASSILRQWLGRGFWRPGDLAKAAEIAKVSPVYVPYWVFQARTHTHWTADSSDLPFGARGDWRPVVGEHHGVYEGLLIGASGVLTPDETSKVCPYHLANAEPASDVNTDNMVVEQFRVQRKYARPLARQGLENLDRDACQRYVPARCRNLRVNVLLEGLSSEPVLLPVWIMAYRYRDHLYRFLINGQTGKATGQAPVSWSKILGAIAIVGLILLLLCLAALVAGGT